MAIPLPWSRSFLHTPVSVLHLPSGVCPLWLPHAGLSTWWQQGSPDGQRVWGYPASEGYEHLSPVPQCPSQVWASSFLPNEARLEDQTQRQHLSQHGVPMLLDYAEQEACRKVKAWMLSISPPCELVVCWGGPPTSRSWALGVLKLGL